MIDPATAWFKMIEIPAFDLNEVMTGDDEYIDKLPARVSQLFNNRRLCRYLHLQKVVFDNIYEFK